MDYYCLGHILTERKRTTQLTGTQLSVQCVCVCVCGVAVAGSMRAACDRERRERTIFSVLRCVTDGSALCRYIVFLVK